MFLKVMHDGADEFLATADSDAAYSIYDDVVSCHFKRYPQVTEGTFGEAKIWVREPIKTATVAGYCEIKKNIVLTGDAFVMNEQGRTISKFLARGALGPKVGTTPKPKSWGEHDFSGNSICICGVTRIQVDDGLVHSSCRGRLTEPGDEERAADAFKNMPYSVAAAVRRIARREGGVTAAWLSDILDRAKVATDA